MTELVLQALWSGVLTGSSYALIALGLALVFGTMNVINLAHGELVLLAAYIAYTCESAWGSSPLLAIPVAIPIVCLATALTYLLVSRIRRDRELNSLLLTYGIGIMLTNGMLLLWRPTSAPRSRHGCRTRWCWARSTACAASCCSSSSASC
jgi:branched-chain amino acid transport system permease protein